MEGCTNHVCKHGQCWHPKMKQVLNTFQMITCPARHYLNSEGSSLFTDEVYGGQNVCMFGGLDDIDILTELSSKFNFIGLDVANGYTVRFVNAVKQLRQNNPDSIIVAGNVVTADMTQELILGWCRYNQSRNRGAAVYVLHESKLVSVTLNCLCD